mmetsp:Transcript_133363/g.371798  ORF Transcript_133363/g.371798 Transcript_133363/m.371798 type:complete len:250 (-) Transcript_133363:1044-1793(-)
MVTTLGPVSLEAHPPARLQVRAPAQHAAAHQDVGPAALRPQEPRALASVPMKDAAEEQGARGQALLRLGRAALPAGVMLPEDVLAATRAEPVPLAQLARRGGPRAQRGQVDDALLQHPLGRLGDVGAQPPLRAAASLHPETLELVNGPVRAGLAVVAGDASARLVLGVLWRQELHGDRHCVLPDESDILVHTLQVRLCELNGNVRDVDLRPHHWCLLGLLLHGGRQVHDGAAGVCHGLAVELLGRTPSS